MCIGIPMQIIAHQGEWALCDGQGQQRLIDMMLLGQQPLGTWVLVFLDTARDVLTPQQATQISDALQAVQLAMHGEAGVDHLFADLVGREPTLPAFLTGQEKP